MEEVPCIPLVPPVLPWLCCGSASCIGFKLVNRLLCPPLSLSLYLSAKHLFVWFVYCMRYYEEGFSYNNIKLLPTALSVTVGNGWMVFFRILSSLSLIKPNTLTKPNSNCATQWVWYFIIMLNDGASTTRLGAPPKCYQNYEEVRDVSELARCRGNCCL